MSPTNMSNGDSSDAFEEVVSGELLNQETEGLHSTVVPEKRRLDASGGIR